MQELWQLYDESGQPLEEQGAPKAEVFAKGLLHGAVHVWIWRQTAAGTEILVQKRASHKMTWPNLFDVSAAGHIGLHEQPLATALRETKEEIGLTIQAAELISVGTHRAGLDTGTASIENEFQWIYLLELPRSVAFTLRKAEVAALQWKPLEGFIQETLQDSTKYVPHSAAYFAKVTAAIEAQVSST